jgi:hypothetical protein
MVLNLIESVGRRIPESEVERLMGFVKPDV